MGPCKHDFGCHSCESSLRFLYDALKEHLEQKQMLDMRFEAAMKMIENILNLEEEKK